MYNSLTSYIKNKSNADDIVYLLNYGNLRLFEPEMLTTKPVFKKAN